MLRHRNVRVLWVSSLFNAIGFGEIVVVGWVVLELSDSAFMVGVALGLRMAPFFFLGLLAGVVADRMDRRTLMQVSSVGAAAVSGVQGLLILLDVVQVWHILLLGLASGSLFAVYMTARQSYAYDLAGPGEVVRSLAVVYLAMQVGGIVGSLVSGYVLGSLGAEVAFPVLGLSYLLSAYTLQFLEHGHRGPVRVREPPLENLKGVGRELRRNHSLLLLVAVIAIIEILGFSHMAVMPSLAKEELHVGAEGLGILNAFRSVGGILATLLFALVRDPERKGALYLLVTFIFGGAIVFLGFASSFALAILAIVLVSGMMALSDVLSQSMIQRVVPDEFRGRAMGAWVLAIGTAPLGNLQIGALASAYGVPLALVANGIGVVIVAIGGFALSSRLRAM